jgi:hypothetical protein
MQAMGTQAGEYEGLLGSPRLQQFLDSEDVSLLDKPLLFQRHAGFGKYLGCVGACMGVFSYGLSTVLCPIGTFCNHTLADQHTLQVSPWYLVHCHASSPCLCGGLLCVQHPLPTCPSRPAAGALSAAPACPLCDITCTYHLHITCTAAHISAHLIKCRPVLSQQLSSSSR